MAGGLYTLGPTGELFCMDCLRFLADRTIGRAIGTACRLSSVCRLSVTFCIVAKRCVLAKKCLKE